VTQGVRVRILFAFSSEKVKGDYRLVEVFSDNLLRFFALVNMAVLYCWLVAFQLLGRKA
jgi:hypothetical protein